MSRIVLDLDAGEQARLLTLLRRARHDHELQLHILLLPARQRSPSGMADWLLCSRDAVYTEYCSRANPVERIFGDLHDKVTRNHTRKQIGRLVKDVERHLAVNPTGGSPRMNAASSCFCSVQSRVKPRTAGL